MLIRMKEEGMSEEKEAAKEFLAAARDLWPAAKGSLARVARPCGRPNQCAACRSGQRHPMWIFTFRQDGRLRCRYVPEELAPALRRAVANGRKLEKRLMEEGALIIERYRRKRSSREAQE